MASKETKVLFGGRLAEYKYYDMVIIQIPPTDRLSLLMESLRKKHCIIVLLAHDVSSIRLDEKMSDEESTFFNQADYLIVHTKKMTERLINDKIKTPMIELNMFDYITNGKAPNLNCNKQTIVFAGNLRKSKFFEEWMSLKNWDIHTYLYGAKFDKNMSNSNFEFKGKFDPDDISNILGGWGLVWDGTSATTCDSYFGEYLKIIAPHKFSLYIATGKPIIIWRQSAMADLVEQKGLGLCVDSLIDIPSLLKNITDDEYNRYKHNVLQISEKIKSGGCIMQVISKLEKYCNEMHEIK